ncbi:uncharacterized protein LOC121369107 isoform X2 [Gigantopelta aegis]|uniref:uncharacterized protein LOC121369107 isoform X2 n=1 Tax=Gigantopelta aegis TaxID=1735272 RepID=UPI001B8878FA|nr:uncharacterized protein LOC121369107 isoform X2 [Gigantopelta aegis]
MKPLTIYLIAYVLFGLLIISQSAKHETGSSGHSSPPVSWNNGAYMHLLALQKRQILAKIARVRRMALWSPNIFGLKLSSLRKLNKAYHMFEAFRDTMDEFPRRIQSKLNKLMASMYYSFVVNETDNVNLPCENHVTDLIRKDYSKSIFRWRHNEKPIELDPSRMVLYKGTLVIRNLQLYDTGVYTCQMEYKPGSRKTVGIYSVLVRTDEINMWVKETLDMTLTCNSHFLGQFYPNASREWFYNNVLFDARANKTNASSPAPDVFHEVGISFNGTWVCRVMNEDPQRTWYPAVYNVMILPPPAFYELIVMYVLKNKARSFLLLVGFTFGGFIILAVMAHYGREYQDSKAKKREIMKEQLLAVLGGTGRVKDEDGPRDEGDLQDGYSSDSGLDNQPSASEISILTNGSVHSETAAKV